MYFKSKDALSHMIAVMHREENVLKNMMLRNLKQLSASTK